MNNSYNLILNKLAIIILQIQNLYPKEITVLLFILMMATLLSAYKLLKEKNSIFALFHLISIYLMSYLMLMILNSSFLALLILLVYIGAITVLFLFVIMMINLAPAVSRKIYITEFLIILIAFIPVILVLFTDEFVRQSELYQNTLDSLDEVYFQPFFKAIEEYYGYAIAAQQMSENEVVTLMYDSYPFYALVSSNMNFFHLNPYLNFLHNYVPFKALSINLNNITNYLYIMYNALKDTTLNAESTAVLQKFFIHNYYMICLLTMAQLCQQYFSTMDWGFFMDQFKEFLNGADINVNWMNLLFLQDQIKEHAEFMDMADSFVNNPLLKEYDEKYFDNTLLSDLENLERYVYVCVQFIEFDLLVSLGTISGCISCEIDVPKLICGEGNYCRAGSIMDPFYKHNIDALIAIVSDFKQVYSNFTYDNYIESFFNSIDTLVYSNILDLHKLYIRFEKYQSNDFYNLLAGVYTLPEIRAIASVLYTEYSAFLIVAGILLFIALIGAVVLTRISLFKVKAETQADIQVRRKPFIRYIS